jgi:hypothetical protein
MILELLKDEYTIYRFHPEYQIPQKTNNSSFISVTKTEDEISVVAVSGAFEQYDKKEDNWKILKIAEELDFNQTGIISKISAILAEAEISIFVISTYNTDYLLVKKDKLEKAINLLEYNNYEIKK